MNDLNVTKSPCNVYDPTDGAKSYMGASRNVYKHIAPLNVTRYAVEVTFMRIGQNELKILKLLMEKDGRVSFYEVKEALTGKGRLKWRNMGYDKYHEIETQHKSLVRSTKTLEEKGLIVRSGYVSTWNNNKLTRIKFLKITEKGKKEYLKRIGHMTEVEG